jgi:hypothetical protein
MQARANKNQVSTVVQSSTVVLADNRAKGAKRMLLV